MSTTTKKAAAKKPGKPPADHLARKAEATEESAAITATVEGVEYVIDIEAMNDVDFTEKLADMMHNGEAQLAPLLVRSLIGVEAWNGWKAAHRNADTGRIPPEALEEFLTALFREVNAGN